MTLKPLFDNVILTQKKQEEKTASGIVLPGGEKNLPMRGTVVAIGTGIMPDGKNVEMMVKVGQEVLYSKYAGYEVEIDNSKYVVLKQTDIQATVE